MKRTSLAGVILGVLLGAAAVLVSGSWIFWLGAGVAIGLIIGAARGRRVQMRGSYMKQGVNS